MLVDIFGHIRRTEMAKSVTKRMLEDFKTGAKKNKIMRKHKIDEIKFSRNTTYLRRRGHNIIKDDNDFFKIDPNNPTIPAKEGPLKSDIVQNSASEETGGRSEFWKRALEVFKQGVSMKDAMKALKVPKTKIHAVRNYLKRKGYNIITDNGLYILNGEDEPTTSQPKSSNSFKFTIAESKLFQGLSTDDKEKILVAKKNIIYNQKLIKSVFEAKQEILNIMQGIGI